jgi:hypothetical protein
MVQHSELEQRHIEPHGMRLPTAGAPVPRTAGPSAHRWSLLARTHTRMVKVGNFKHAGKEWQLQGEPELVGVLPQQRGPQGDPVRRLRHRDQ